MGCNRYDRFFRNLANRTNLRIIELLESNDKMNVRSLVDNLGKEQSAVSHCLSKLSACNIVKVEKKGRERYYHLNSDMIRPMFDLVDHHAYSKCKNCSYMDNK